VIDAGCFEKYPRARFFCSCVPNVDSPKLSYRHLLEISINENTETQIGQHDFDSQTVKAYLRNELLTYKTNYNYFFYSFVWVKRHH